jgi:transposase
MYNKSSITSKAGVEQAASKIQIIKLGLDVHAEFIVVVRMLDHSTPQPPQRFTPEKFLAWIPTQLKAAQQVHSCYEAGPFGYGLHRKLTELGVRNLVIQPVCLDERHKGVNNDKTDALELCTRLDRYVAGNQRALAIVTVPTPEQEQKRIHSRQREQLKREIKRIAAQGRSLLLCQGFREKGKWWKEARWSKLSQTLPAWLVQRLEIFGRLLAALEKEESALRAQIEGSAPSGLPKGMGAFTLQAAEREVGDWNRFKNRRQIGSYTGLCGGVSSSGQSARLLSITKHGNQRLRTLLVELAWRMVIWQPQSHAVQGWREQLTQRAASKASARKKAIVAVARQLAIDLWRWRTGRASAQELGWIV